MDIKLKSNDGEGALYAAPEEKPAVKRKGRVNARGMLLLLALVFGAACIFISETNLAYYYRHINDMQSLTRDDAISVSWYIQDNLQRYAKNVHRYYNYFDGIGYASLPDEERLTKADLDEAASAVAAEYAASLDELMNMVREYSLESKELVTEIGRLDERFELEASEQALRVRALANKNANYEDVRNYLQTQQEFRYYITKGAVAHTNISDLGAMSIDDYIEISLEDGRYYAAVPLNHQVFSHTDFTGLPLAQAFARDGIHGYIFIAHSNPAQQVDNEWQAVMGKSAPNDYHMAYWIFFAGSIAFLALAIALSLKNVHGVVSANRWLYGIYMRMPFVVKAGGAIICAVAVYGCIRSPYDILGRMFSFGGSNALFMTMLTGCMLLLLLCVEYVIITARHPQSLKSEPEVKLCVRIIGDVRYVILATDVTVGMLYALMVALALVGSGFSLMLVFNSYPEAGLLLLAMVAVLAFLGHGFVAGYARLVYYVKRMAGGDMSGIPEARGMFMRPLRELSRVNEGLNRAAGDMMRSERLKTELITNVSHDLKTPLTSIINYVALLKKEPAQSAAAAEYLDILEKKSERLGALIEDLFEASKLQSGSAELNRERLDLVDLLEQAMGELSEKIEASGVDFRFRHSPEHIYYDCDGKKMWRAFENILGNIIKYSPSGSRAYIEAVQTLTAVELTFKNMSAYELNVEPDELFNRFKRGDSARVTEGNGLGLAIAQGIIELHGGQMRIEVDGDLFKTMIRL